MFLIIVLTKAMVILLITLLGFGKESSIIAIAGFTLKTTRVANL